MVSLFVDTSVWSLAWRRDRVSSSPEISELERALKAGEAIYLSYLPGTPLDRVADCVRFEGQLSGTTWGRYADGDAFWRTCAPRTR